MSIVSTGRAKSPFGSMSCPVCDTQVEKDMICYLVIERRSQYYEHYYYCCSEECMNIQMLRV